MHGPTSDEGAHLFDINLNSDTAKAIFPKLKNYPHGFSTFTSDSRAIYMYILVNSCIKLLEANFCVNLII